MCETIPVGQGLVEFLVYVRIMGSGTQLNRNLKR